MWKLRITFHHQNIKTNLEEVKQHCRGRLYAFEIFCPFHMSHQSPFPVVLLPPTSMWKVLPRWVYVCVYTRVWFPSLLPSPSFLRRHLLVSQVLSIFPPPIRLPESVWRSPQKPESLVSPPLCMHIVPSAYYARSPLNSCISILFPCFCNCQHPLSCVSSSVLNAIPASSSLHSFVSSL